MYVDAIENVGRFTRPMITVQKSYASKTILPGTATLFFVNDDGCAVTCKHVAEILINEMKIAKGNAEYSALRNQIPKDAQYNSNLRKLQARFSITSQTLQQLKYIFIECFDTYTSIDIVIHPLYDLALLKFKGFSQRKYAGHAVFLKTATHAKQGRSLCRLGFPFPEFQNYELDEISEEIRWTATPAITPRFPIEGILTRLVMENGEISGIEMSTPGLRGQSGGPLFDSNGIIYGMQSSTRHVHLGFDIIDQEILSQGHPKKVTDYQFLNLGICLPSEIIKNFLKQQNVAYFESD